MSNLDKFSKAYDQLLASYYPKVEPITEAGDWHLLLVWIPDGKPEVIYSIDFRNGKLSIILVRFLESAWRKFCNAYSQEQEKVDIEIERGEMDLPDDHSIVELIKVGLPRLCENDSQAVLDGEQFKLTFTDYAGVYESQIWAPYQKQNDAWIKLIDSVRGAGALVPRRFAVGYCETRKAPA